MTRKRSSKQTCGSRSKKKKPVTHERDEMNNPGFEVNVQVPVSLSSKWQPMSRSTRGYVERMLDDAALTVKQRGRPEMYVDIAAILGQARERINTRCFARGTFPKPECDNYESIGSLQAGAKKELELLKHCQEQMIQEIDRQQASLERLQTECSEEE